MALTESPGLNGVGTPDADALDFKIPEGIVVPPPQTRQIIEKTVGPVVRNGKRFEDKIKTDHGDKPRFSFLFAHDPYNAYYLWRIEEHKAGRALDDAGKAIAKKAPEKPKGLEPPPDFEFSARMPPISAQDLDVVHKTAQFVAIHGRGFLMSLSQREAGNPQFDFLRSTHSYNQYFNRLVDQYTDLRTARTQNGGLRQQDRMAELEEIVKDKFTFLEKAKKRAEWVKYQEKEKQKKEEKEEADKVAFAQIDWQDFYIAEVVVFNEGEDLSHLPAPTSIGELQALSLEQKAAMTVIGSNMRIEETVPGTEFDNQYAIPTPPIQPAPAVHIPQPAPAPVHTPVQVHVPPPVASPLLGAPGFSPSSQPPESAAGAPPMRVRDTGAAVPRALARRRGAQVTLVPCPNCGQQIPSDEFEAHIRIELQDPRWREQKAKADSRFSTTNLHAVDVASNLKRLASHRDDIFDPLTGEPISEEEQARRKRAAVVQAPDADDVGRTVKLPMGQTMDINEQIKNIQAKYKGHQNGE